MTQIFITLPLLMAGTLGRSNLRGIRTPQRHSLGCGPVPSLPAGEEFPRHIGKAFAFGLADSIGVLCVETHFSVLVDDLGVQRENHIFLKNDVALRANGRILKHRGTDAVAGEMSERAT